jgi:PAS domain S-box-containing protein
MGKPISILVVEDRAIDAEIVIRELRRSGFDPEWKRVETEQAYLGQLHAGLDLVLSDYELPHFSGLRALQLLKQQELDIPFIIVSGTIGEETAVAAMKDGASDYLLKDRPARLGSAVDHVLEESRLRREGRRAEKALKLFRALVDNSNDAFEVIDPQTARFLDVNDRGCANLGYTREEFLELGVYDIDPTVTEQAWPQLIEKLRQLGSMRVEGRHLRKDRTTFPVEVGIRLVKLDREYLVAVVRDITERRQIEESLRESEVRFRQLAENINEVFWISNSANNEMLYISPAFEAIWGIGRQSLNEVLREWVDAIHPADRARVMDDISGRRERGEYDVTYRIQRPDGSLRRIHDRAFPIRNPDGQVYRIVGIAEDITRQHGLEEQVRQTQKMEAMGTLAGGIAHDFNNILTAMNGYSELARMRLGESNPVVGGYLDAVLQGGTRAASLVRRILTFSRQEEQQKTPIQLRDVVEETLKLLRATLPATITFRTSFASDLPTVLADSTQIHQILMNLGTNALHAMRGRPGFLEIKLENFEVDLHAAEAHPRLRLGHSVRLSVSDSGSGMDKATQERIFEPFFTTKGPGEGTGLGLSVVYGIMQSHEGAITVYSEPGQGTTFHLYFPVHSGEVSKALPADGPIPHGHGQHILYVDDEEPLALLGKRTLEQLGYKVEISTNVVEALELVRSNPKRFDLVITDQTMPSMTGVDFAGHLINIRPNIPIVLASGYTAGLSPARLGQTGIRELLVKPLTIRSLAAATHRALTERKPA